MSNEATVRNYILENFLFTDDQSALSNDSSLLDEGVLDSTGILELVVFLEDELGIKVDDHEMVPDNLDSVDNILKYISSKSS